MWGVAHACPSEEYPLLCKTVPAVRIGIFSVTANPFGACFNEGSFSCLYKCSFAQYMNTGFKSAGGARPAHLQS